MYRKMILPVMLVVAVLSSGCSIKHPLSAAEFRKELPGSMFGKRETFYTNRDFKDVANNFKKMAPKCLHKRITSTSSGYMYHSVVVTDYNPTVILKGNKVELHLQQDHVQGVMNVSEKPKGGYYMLVTDAEHAGKNKTKVDMYYASIGSDNIVKAIKSWANGGKGCPDLTKP